jgi:hypothetical protein
MVAGATQKGVMKKRVQFEFDCQNQLDQFSFFREVKECALAMQDFD